MGARPTIFSRCSSSSSSLFFPPEPPNRFIAVALKGLPPPPPPPDLALPQPFPANPRFVEGKRKMERRVQRSFGRPTREKGTTHAARVHLTRSEWNIKNTNENFDRTTSKFRSRENRLPSRKLETLS